ncbi:hypothetical protein BB560_005029, partial [Smittium megazygosporum]
MNTLKIGYWNVRGLSDSKWNVAIKCITNQVVDILFLAETWFVKQHIRSNHPLFFTASKITQISSSITTEYTVGITVNGFKILAVYFPPSMDIASIDYYMPKTTVDTIIGDINTQFGVKFGTKKVGPLIRKNYFLDHCNANGLIHLIPDPPESTPDHAFLLEQHKGKWIFRSDVSLDLSDHSLMVLETNISKPDQPEKSSDSIKFNLRPLEAIQIQGQLIAVYEENRSVLQNFIMILKRLPINLKFDQTRQIVNGVYFSFTTLLYTICEEILGTYSVHQVNSNLNPKKMDTFKELNKYSAKTKATMLFKRAQKSNTVHQTINSRDPNIS